MEAAAERGFDYHYVVQKQHMQDFIVKCAIKVGCDPIQAESIGRMLIYADERGHFSHGINRLHVYLRDLSTKTCNPNGEPKILKKKGATALVDGDNALGSTVGEYCMNLAYEIAAENGIGWVTANNSNHFGAAGRYGHFAADKGMIGFAFTNTSPTTFPTRSSQKALGTNPISIVAPAKGNDRFALDMATSTVAFGKIEIAERKGKDYVPAGWGANEKGIEEHKPEIILKGGGTLPLGGIEERGGYKGTGLCQMVEILCGIMAGGPFGKNIREWTGTAQKADLGQCYIAVDPECFAEGFTNRLQEFLDETRTLEPIDPSLPVRCAGDFSKSHNFLTENVGGLVYHKSQIEYLHQISKEHNIPFFEVSNFKAPKI
uniref:Malate dehydrogenase n=1 Tax=Panagrolaimus sp. PS1159 TaxID=55785 RepID=A0AC35GK14_9BILA